MKKTLFIMLGVFCLFLFGAFAFYARNLGWNHRTNHFIQGEFVGVNESNDSEVFYFTVTSISKDEFASSEGINVVYDNYLKKHFILSLYYQVNGSEEKTHVNFKNLNAYGSPISYKDDYGSYMTPWNKPNQSKPLEENC